MENSKMLNLINRFSWLALIGLVIYYFASNKGCTRQSMESSFNERDKLENVKQRLTQTGPFMFWHGDSLDVHTVGADFMQYYEPKKHNYTREEAMNAVFYSSTNDNEDKIAFKLHPIKPQPSNYEMPEKMLVLGGNVSNFRGFKTFLIGNGVVDKAFNWTFGKGHLVINGGPMYSYGTDNEFLHWLMYKLEQEATIAGGKVHIILGQNPFEKKRRQEVDKLNDNRPDFFKLQNWYSDTIFQKNSEMGRWIYSKNVIENIGGYLIAESGLSEELIDELPLDTINKILIDAFNFAKQGDNGNFYIDQDTKTRLFKPKPNQEEYNYDYTHALFGNIAYQKSNNDKHYNPENSDKRVDRLLKLYNAKHFIGRFPFLKGNISTANNNKYLGDIPDITKRSGGGSTNNIRYNGIWIENKQVFVVDDEGKKTLLFKD